MRIATWNLNHGGSARAETAQQEILLSHCEDIVVLTEPPASYRSGPGVVASPALRSGSKAPESWIAIVGPGVEPIGAEIPFARMAVAARATVGGRNVIVYGSVLPWNAFRAHAPEIARSDESADGAFVRVLGEQVADIKALREAHQPDLMIWAGDFNQTVTGPNWGGSATRREALLEALSELGFDAWNGGQPHAKPEMCAIDLICGPKEIRPTNQGRIDPTFEATTMSDHAGYWVELSL